MVTNKFMERPMSFMMCKLYSIFILNAYTFQKIKHLFLPTEWLLLHNFT